MKNSERMGTGRGLEDGVVIISEWCKSHLFIELWPFASSCVRSGEAHIAYHHSQLVSSKQASDAFAAKLFGRGQVLRSLQ